MNTDRPQSSTQAISPSMTAILDRKIVADPLSKSFEVAEYVAVAGDEITLAVFEISDRSEAVDF
jgi:hypothetical protein